MDLASGYSDSINYGNGYTPLATGAINNNNAEYQRNQMAMAMMAQAYNPYANSGGSFGAQPAYYAGLGRDYTTATGGNIFGGNSFSGWDPYAYGGSSGGIGSDAARSPDQPEIPQPQPQPQSQLPWFWQGVRDYTGMGQPGGSGYDPYAGLGNQGQPGVTDPMGYGSGGYQGNEIPYQNRAPVQGGTTDPFWQGIRDLTGADPKYQGRVGDLPQQPIPYPQAGGFGSPGFGPYGGSSYTGQPGYGLGTGTMGAPTQQPDYSQQWENWLMSGMRGTPPNPYQNAGLSMQDRNMTPQQFAWAPTPKDASLLWQGNQYANATDTSPALSPDQTYWGGHVVKFPVAAPYPDEDPRVNTTNTDLGFGSDQYPLIGLDHNNNPNLLDPNMLNRNHQQQQNLGSG
jgi:hypothetical protein